MREGICFSSSAHTRLRDFTAGGGFVHGVARAASTEWGAPQPCNIHPTRNDREGQYAPDGRFVRYAATVLVEQPMPVAARVRLTDLDGTERGDFEVQGARRLEAVGATELTLGFA